MKILPRKKYILVKPQEEESRVSKSGIVTPTTVEQEKKSIGKVIAVGKDVTDIKIGDKIIFGVYAGDVVKSENEEYKILHDDDILAVIL